MVGEDVVDFQEGAVKQHVGDRAFASSTEGERGVRWKDALEVLRGRLVCASPMVVDAVVNPWAVIRAHRGAPCSAKLMVVEKDAYLQAARKALKGARPSAKGTVVENVACLMGVGYARKVCMEVRVSVLLMAEERGVLFPTAPRAPVAGLIVASNMEGGSGVRSRTVGRVLRAVLTSARPMVVERGATGERENAKSLQGERVVCVLHTAAWSRGGRITKEE